MRETVLRTSWIFLTPIVWLANRVGLCSYAWVNLCIGARRPDLFDPLWHHEHFGTPIETLPDELVLCGIGYRVAVAEGTVTFVEDFTRSRITFDRDPYGQMREALWYVSLSGWVAAPHVRAAYAWVSAVFGGSFEYRREPVTMIPTRRTSDG